MWKLFQIEVYKIFRRPRTYIAFAAITALIVIVQLGLKSDGKEYAEFIMSDLKNSIDVEGNIVNGYFVCYVVLQLLLIHVPLLIALIAGDMISGESNAGTLRLLLTKPFSRTQFIFAKFFASVFYTILLLVWIAILALFVSILIFGTDDMFIMKTQYAVQIENGDVFWRYVGAFCFAALAMTTVAALAFFLSQFAENSIGPIVATMSVIIVFTILSTMSLPIFAKIRPWLFTTHMVTWKEFFDIKVNDANESIRGTVQHPERLIRSALILTGHIIIFLGVTVGVFKRKDILS